MGVSIDDVANMADTKSYYKTLGVPSTASEKEIKQAYRSLSMELHPDRNSGKQDTTAAFQKINEAYETLGDSTLKSEYDLPPQQNNPFGAQFGGVNVSTDFGDIQNMVNMMFGGDMVNMKFGGGGGGMHMGGMPGMHGFPGGIHIVGGNGGIFAQMQKPPAIIVNARVSLEQCYTGCDVSIELDRWKCVSQTERMQEHITINISIPAGMDENDVIQLPNLGNIVNEQLKGDVKVMIQVSNDTGFIRQGHDLILNKTVSLKEALCGFSFTVKHLTGKMITMDNTSVPTIIRPKYRKLIPGLGMIKNGQTGNIIIEFDVLFPESLTTDQIDKLLLIL